ncbi:transmembrane emp24 domain-containing protein p24beta2-like isoform X2 [Chenopodium quinoa]|uniref:transmembrane emp24 domain-containing protein p24beta2-like isoform X2 n=1 Tax=Chenopodium quinoa TaxID=63459 RepID=UPI000B77D66F|nr:transmembrane emp24 domain-containing protein p24beta2-like isoform X2 [Chenopodium quinoa]
MQSSLLSPISLYLMSLFLISSTLPAANPAAPKLVFVFRSSDFLQVSPPWEELKGPEGDQILDTHDKISEKFNFTAHKQGPFSFCFTNKSPYHETIDFDLQVGHFTYYDQHAKDEHVKPLVEQIEKLGQCLYNIQFEQHWLEAQTDRQALGTNMLHRNYWKHHDST